MYCSKRLVLGKTCDTPEKKVICQVCYNSKLGPKTLGFVTGGEGGSGLDVAKSSETSSNKTSSSGDSDEFAQLEKLASLRDKGIITEKEFAAKKKQILGL
jgi:hypothetical protein